MHSTLKQVIRSSPCLTYSVTLLGDDEGPATAPLSVAISETEVHDDKLYWIALMLLYDIVAIWC